MNTSFGRMLFGRGISQMPANLQPAFNSFTSRQAAVHDDLGL